MASKADEEATIVNSGAEFGESAGYPRLMGMPIPTTAAKEVYKRRVTFQDEAHNLAEESRNAFLALQQRVTDRTMANNGDNVSIGNPTTVVSESDDVHPRLLGRPGVMPTTNAVPKHRLNCDVDAHALAQDARASFMAMQQRVSTRRLPKYID